MILKSKIVNNWVPTGLKDYFTHLFRQRFFPLRKDSVYLDRRHIYVLPTRSGLLFGLILWVMLIGSMNYNNNLGYMLTFLLASMTLVSILHTHRMLLGLQVAVGKVKPVFAGDTAQFQVWIDNRGQLARYALHWHRHPAPASLWKITRNPQFPPQLLDIPSNQRIAITVAVPTQQRGRLALGRILVMTTFPLGLFRAWAYVDLDMTTLVYPQPLGNRFLPSGHSAANGGHVNVDSSGSDDFTGYRDYKAGDSPRHIHWKAVAREQGWLLKQFGNTSHATVWLTWDAVSHLHHVEAGLSQLCLWVLIADSQGICYGLDIPECVLEPATGDTHRERCLQALALYC